MGTSNRSLVAALVPVSPSLMPTCLLKTVRYAIDIFAQSLDPWNATLDHRSRKLIDAAPHATAKSISHGTQTGVAGYPAAPQSYSGREGTYVARAGTHFSSGSRTSATLRSW